MADPLPGRMTSEHLVVQPAQDEIAQPILLEVAAASATGFEAAQMRAASATTEDRTVSEVKAENENQEPRSRQRSAEACGAAGGKGAIDPGWSEPDMHPTASQTPGKIGSSAGADFPSPPAVVESGSIHFGGRAELAERAAPRGAELYAAPACPAPPRVADTASTVLNPADPRAAEPGPTLSKSPAADYGSPVRMPSSVIDLTCDDVDFPPAIDPAKMFVGARRARPSDPEAEDGDSVRTPAKRACGATGPATPVTVVANRRALEDASFAADAAPAADIGEADKGVVKIPLLPSYADSEEALGVTVSLSPLLFSFSSSLSLTVSLYLSICFSPLCPFLLLYPSVPCSLDVPVSVRSVFLLR